MHETLLEKVWGLEYRGENHYLKVYIGRLRDKLRDRDTRPKVIELAPQVKEWLASRK